MPESSYRFAPSRWYQRVPAGPPPETLAEQLKTYEVHRKASRRLDDLDRIDRDAAEHRKAQVKLTIGALGLVLGTVPSVPGLVTTCEHASGWQCALRVGALLGALCGLSCALWSAYDLSRNTPHFSEQVKRLDEELDRAIQCRTGEARGGGIFRNYLRYTRDERAALKAFLHEAGKEPKPAMARWRQVGVALGV